MIQGFPSQSSVLPSGTVTLHASTDAPQFRVEMYRQGASLKRVLSSCWFDAPGINIPCHGADQDWCQDHTGE